MSYKTQIHKLNQTHLLVSKFCARNKDNLVSWAKMPLNKHLLISLRVMSLTSAQVQNHKLLALKQL